MSAETKKMNEYVAVFGQNVSLVFFPDGSGRVEIGVRDVRGFFTDSFENVAELLKKDPKETQRNAKKWGWI